jgi:hypothetical protein
MRLTDDEIRTAEQFFRRSDVAVLENQSRQINTAQPNFAATVLAMEMHGLTRDKEEDILESIFVIYYVHTVLRKKKLNSIGIGQIAKNIKWFESFLNFYNREKSSGEEIDLAKIKFLKDDTILRYAAGTLLRMFG